MNRREFVKAAGGAVALGGGVFLTGKDGKAVTDADVAKAMNDFRIAGMPTPPRRLRDETRALAQRGLAGEHGRSLKNADFALDPAEIAGLSLEMRYAHAVKLIAEKAPLRILPFEQVVGSATLLEACHHSTPVIGIGSTSHLTLGFDRILREGYKGIREQILATKAKGKPAKTEPIRKAVRGKFGGALPANAACSCWVEAPPRNEYVTPPLTVECWARLEANSSDRFNVIVANAEKNSALHWEIYSYADTGNFSAYLPGYAPAEINSDRLITDGKWHHLTMAFTGNTVRLFVDGEKVADARVKATGQLPKSPGPLWIGGYPPHSIGCQGLVEDVRISNVARSITQAPENRFELDDHTVALWRIDRPGQAAAYHDASRLANHAKPVTLGNDLLDAMLICLDGAERWHKRYMDALTDLAAKSTGAERENVLRVREALRRVPEEPPRTFHEAVQSLWFAYAFQRLAGNWSGIGRIDEMLGPFLERDLAEGRLTLDEAREILAHFWIKGTEWIGALKGLGSGDAQHYQNIVLSGVDADGNDVTNAVTYLVLDIVEELHISDFPIAVRLNRNTPEKLLRRIAEVQRYGGGIVAVYNEEAVIDGFVQFGYPLREARRFANDGCWEALIPGKTSFIYHPMDMLTILQDALGLHDAKKPPPDFASFDDLYAAFVEKLTAVLDHHHRMADNYRKNGPPSTLISMLIEGCIESQRGYNDRGAKYTVFAPHMGGIANVADSLSVIRKLVYEDKYLTLPEFVEILRNDWKGHEHLRKLVLSRFAFYGNDDEGADAMVERVFNDYTEIAARVKDRNGVLRPAGISTFGREIGWRKPNGPRKATPDGHKLGEILATNLSPSPGTDRKGPTAVIKSYCKMDYARLPNGGTLELKIHPESVRGEKGVDALVALLKTFVTLGGWFMHVDVVDTAMLIDAQRHPEKYPNLAVRIAGWSARFHTLTKEWQDMVIQRTQQMV